MNIRRPLPFILVLDAALLVAVIAQRLIATYDTAILLVFVVAGLVLLQLPACVWGFVLARRTAASSAMYFYGGHFLASIVLFVAAELGWLSAW